MDRCCVARSSSTAPTIIVPPPGGSVNTNEDSGLGRVKHLTSRGPETSSGASSFQEAVATMLQDLHTALCRQHEIFAAQNETEEFRTQTIKHVPVGAMLLANGHSAEPVQNHGGMQTADNHGVEVAPAVSVEHHCESSPADTRDHARAIMQDAEIQTRSVCPSLFSVLGSTRTKQTEQDPVHLHSLHSSHKPHPKSKSVCASSLTRGKERGSAAGRISKVTSVAHHQDIAANVPPESREVLREGSMRQSRLSLGEFVDFNKVFQTFMNVAVLSNVMVLGFQVGSDWFGWLIVDCIYVIIFTVEMVYRLARGGLQVLMWTDPDWRWNWFDNVLIFLTTAEVALTLESVESDRPMTDNVFSKFSQLRMLRIIRILRILRLSHIDFFKDLGLMVVGTIGGARTLLWSMVMLIVPVYAVALLFTDTLGTAEHPGVAELFSTVRMSMFTTFRCLVLGDCSAADGTPIFPHVLKEFGWGYILIYCLSCVCMSFGLFNVIVAVYVESTVAAAKANESVQRERRLEDKVRLNCKLYELVHFVYREFDLGLSVNDYDHESGLAAVLSAEMTSDVFNKVIQNNTVRTLLHECDVPEDDFPRLFEICDADGGGLLSLDEIVGGIRRLRGVPRSSDLVWVILRIQDMQNSIHALHALVEESLPSTSARSVPGG